MKKKNLSNVETVVFDGIEKMKIGIVQAEWNPEVTDALHDGAIESLLASGIKEENIITYKVPGSFELPLGAQMMIEQEEVDGVICLGCVIQGETRHFDFISQAVAIGIKDVNLDYNMPVAFGVLTTDNFEQAKERSGGKHGNKGVEAAVTTLGMLRIRK